MRSFGALAALALLSTSAVAQPLNGQRHPALDKRASNASLSSTTSRAAVVTSQSTTTSPKAQATSTTSAAAFSSTSIVVQAAAATARSSSSAAATTSRPSSSAAATSSSAAAQQTTAAAGAQVVFQTVTVTATAAATTVTVSIQGPTFTSTVTQTVGTATTTSFKTLYVPSSTVAPLPFPTPLNSSQYTYQNNAVNTSDITQFLGVNEGIASWFRTNNAEDSTNGHSWCSFPYNDTLPGFAPSLGRMLSNFNGNYQAAGEAYCGLEAVFTTPEGRNATLFVIDAFDDTWVKTPGSVDVITGVFPLLYGSQTVQKNDVVQGVQWKWTGRRAEQFKFNGVGSG